MKHFHSERGKGKRSHSDKNLEWEIHANGATKVGVFFLGGRICLTGERSRKQYLHVHEGTNPAFCLNWFHPAALLSVLLSCTSAYLSYATGVVRMEWWDKEQTYTLAGWDTGQSCLIESVLVTRLPLDTSLRTFGPASSALKAWNWGLQLFLLASVRATYQCSSIHWIYPWVWSNKHNY